MCALLSGLYIAKKGRKYVLKYLDELLAEVTKYLLQGPCDKWGGSQQDPWFNRSVWRSPSQNEDAESQIVCPHRKMFLHVEENLQRIVKTIKDERRAGLGLDIHSRQRKTEIEKCCNIISGVPTTFEVMGLNWTDLLNYKVYLIEKK